MLTEFNKSIMLVTDFFQKLRFVFLKACRGHEVDDGVEVPVNVTKTTATSSQGHYSGLDAAGDNLDSRGASAYNPMDTPTSSNVDPPKFHKQV